MAKQDDQFKKVVSHAKEYGYIFQSSEIYDGLSAVYDYGPNGALLKNNIKEYWFHSVIIYKYKYLLYFSLIYYECIRKLLYIFLV